MRFFGWKNFPWPFTLTCSNVSTFISKSSKKKWKLPPFAFHFIKLKSIAPWFSELNLHSRLRQPSDLYLQLYFLEEFKVCIRISSNWAKNIQKKFFTLTFCRQKQKKYTLYSLSSHKYFLLLKYEWTINEKYKIKVSQISQPCYTTKFVYIV